MSSLNRQIYSWNFFPRDNSAIRSEFASSGVMSAGIDKLFEIAHLFKSGHCPGAIATGGETRTSQLQVALKAIQGVSPKTFSLKWI